MKKVRQGHTKFKVVVYEPGKIDGYDDRHVACVYTCAVTKVVGPTIYYTTERGPYLANVLLWHNKLFSTRRKALRYARQQIDKIDKENGYK
jgi:hypothetical protein